MNTTEKRIQTNLAKYGVDNVSKLKSVQDKRYATFESKKTVLIYYHEPRVNVITADDMEVYMLDKTVADNWLDMYHPMKAPRGNVLSLGLVKNNTIYAIMTFKKSRNKAYSAELSRLAMLPTWNVINGYDKLSHYASEFGVYSVIAYVNTSFENIQDYESIGMKFVRAMQPTKWWIRNEKMMSDASRRQRKIKQEDMTSNGYLPVYDCGQRVYVFE